MRKRPDEERGAIVAVPADHDATLVAAWNSIEERFEERRYDTRFFLARMPEHQQARHDDSETTAFAWLTLLTRDWLLLPIY